MDCDKEHGFDNANHRDGEMADLCVNGPKIKQLIILMRSIPSLQYRLTPDGVAQQKRPQRGLSHVSKGTGREARNLLDTVSVCRACSTA
jgi:hypothetical protein